ncbi:SGNH/GDSL hydrolase family protein [Saccharomonospora sp. NPDC046836]|uniref:SGNH/GDSL hydrolase family protein n=1 Tax=Saccharomonospora sp. NPDC046836 TaxID=3156921 RepID=UPI0033DCA8D9
MRVRRRVTAIFGAVLLLLLSSLAAAGTATAAPKFTRYVALGDSYTAGPLIPMQRLDPLGCFRSTRNYPAQLARQLDVKSYTDVSCSGADTSHLSRPQEVTLGVNPPQFDALRPNTDLVTIGIGGNDESVFGRLVGTCPQLRASDPAGSPCQEHFTVDGVDTLDEAIARTGERVAAVLDGVHARSPRATVLVIGYPRIAPPSGTCPGILPFADGDYAWLNSIEEALNDALAKAVADDGRAVFVDLYPASLGHDACAGTDAWIQGKDTNPLGAASYHPRFSGMAGVATEIFEQLRASRAGLPAGR